MTSAAPNSPQLSAENLRELQVARQSLRKIRRAVSTARLEGYSIAVFGGLSFLCGIGSISAMLLGAVLTAIGIVEILAAGGVSRLNLKAVRTLTINQLCLALLIVLYAVWNLHAQSTQPAASAFPDLSTSEVQDLGEMGASAMDISHELMMLLYGSLIVAAIGEAGMAAYYHSRGRHLQRYLAETPAWILAMQKSGIAI